MNNPSVISDFRPSITRLKGLDGPPGVDIKLGVRLTSQETFCGSAAGGGNVSDARNRLAWIINAVFRSHGMDGRARGDFWAGVGDYPDMEGKDSCWQGFGNRIYAARSKTVRAIEVNMERRRNEGAGETGDPRENPQTSGIVRHDSHLRKSGDPAGD
ncbi:hypothetical protein PR048_032243 [Dryococelus australis]|uniref:Uncharacterized protein n=1 Tax=Dryococelus australis TaxID=614101 RepID=A0ABQ9G1N9_9NEOP|nr:hypothetical protein PR048_032243 [Dryococelus australis]